MRTIKQLINLFPLVCIESEAEAEDLHHAFFLCNTNSTASLATIGWTQTLLAADLSTERVLHLDLGEEELYDERALAVSRILEVRAELEVPSRHGTAPAVP